VTTSELKKKQIQTLENEETVLLKKQKELESNLSEINNKLLYLNIQLLSLKVYLPYE
jgi:predicted nuclease with TOPRIM domain